ncbi:hypothetical protein BT96DRAFT_1004100 [Gymnopus androsaceus JB14]|uniref:Uncharacterized protein n=1 Tax=Gymnopus androsaceus JB14 TaxID=1447944 RepID=A0A6A4GT87_9AGAR|nr:hypothetical protein BT96DRAFT_1004100 [Gymnopus androsaceus JB14]
MEYPNSFHSNSMISPTHSTNNDNNITTSTLHSSQRNQQSLPHSFSYQLMLKSPVNLRGNHSFGLPETPAQTQSLLSLPTPDSSSFSNAMRLERVRSSSNNSITYQHHLYGPQWLHGSHNQASQHLSPSETPHSFTTLHTADSSFFSNNTHLQRVRSLNNDSTTPRELPARHSHKFSWPHGSNQLLLLAHHSFPFPSEIQLQPASPAPLSVSETFFTPTGDYKVVTEDQLLALYLQSALETKV